MIARGTAAVVAAALALFAPRRSAADDDDADADLPAASATSTRLGRTELARRPHGRPSDLVRHLPGLAAILHGNGARAAQYLVRGFDAGQGGELAIFVDGVPVNAISHAHAHGYADLQFVIPAAIESISLHLGPYAARYGELATAGALELQTIDRLPRGQTSLSLTSGNEITGSQLVRRRLRRLLYRLTGLTSPDWERGSALLAAEVGIADGPYVHPQRFRRGAVLGKVRYPIGGDGELTAAVQLYAGRWGDSGLLPAREVAAGHLGPFSATDPTQGGIATRTSASLGASTRDRRGGTWHLAGYVVGASTHLYTNPSGYLRDPEAGDQLASIDRRVTYGLDAYHRRTHWGSRGRLRLGVQARADDATGELWHTERRHLLADCFEVANPCNRVAPHVRDVAVYAEEALALHPRVRLDAGLRLDQYTWDVEDLDPETALGPATLGGTGARARVSPKLGAVVRPADAIELSARAAGGVHGTDARAAVDASTYGAYVRTWTGEIGVRVSPDERLRAAAALWSARLEGHQRWREDLGASEPVAPSRRHGLDASIELVPVPWLALDGHVAIARGSAGSEPLVAAPRLIAGGGVAVGREGRYAALRVRALGARVSADAAQPTSGHVLVDLVAAYRWRAFELTLSVDNLLDRDWRELEQAGPVRSSRFAEATEDILFTPGVPLTALLTISVGW